MNKKKFQIVLILVLFCSCFFLLFAFQTPIVEKQENILHNDYEKIKKKLNQADVKDGYYKIQDQILTGNDKKQKLELKSSGEIYKVKKNKLYGYLIYKDMCYRFDFIGIEMTSKEECQKLSPPKRMEELVTINQKQIKKDDASTGVYKTDEYGSQYYFIGENPDNYILFSDQCFRILSVSKNGSVKIIFENEKNKVTKDCQNVTSNVSGNVGLTAWDYDKKKISNWDFTSLKRLINEWVLFKKVEIGNYQFTLSLDDLEDVFWNIGLVGENETLLQDIEDEMKTKTQQTSKIGLINNSDYLKISCQSSSKNSTSTCSEKNYLYKEKYQWWTIHQGSETEKKAWIVTKDGKLKNQLIPFSHEYYFSGTRPVMYLKKDLYYIGNGSPKKPYQIVEKK